MKKFSASVNGHLIEMEVSFWSGKERVHCDGQMVSEKRSLMYITAHSFKILEQGEEVVYEVNILTGWGGYGYIIRRNGIIAAHKP